MTKKLHALAKVFTAFAAVVLVTSASIREVDAGVNKYVATEKQPSINVTRSTTDESGAIVGINVAPSDDVPTAAPQAAAKQQEAPKTTTTVAGISVDKLAMANVADYCNVRAEADEKAALAGKLYKGCGGEVVDKKSGWTKIKSGKLTGWVRNDFLVFGSSAATLAEKSLAKTATATTDSLRVRTEPNEYAEIATLMGTGDTAKVVETHGDWVLVELPDGTKGYVSGQYVTISNDLGKGETIEQINAKSKAADTKTADTQTSETPAAVETPAETAAPQAPAAVNNGAIAATADDVSLLAAIIQCEAGNEVYEGQVAVGAVVVNRLRAGRYGATLYDVIYAPNQFTPAGTGQVANVLAAGPKASCIQAATEALSGVSTVGSCTSFRPVKSGRTGIVIGNHVFW